MVIRPGSVWQLSGTRPISDEFGLDRGQPVDRLYAEHFLAACAADIKGRVLEFGDRAYTEKFGGDTVTQSDVWDIDSGKEAATIIGDPRQGHSLPGSDYGPGRKGRVRVCWFQSVDWLVARHVRRFEGRHLADDRLVNPAQMLVR